MVEYDGRAWFPILIRARGSVIPRLLPRIAATAALGVAAVLLLHRHGSSQPVACPQSHTTSTP